MTTRTIRIAVEEFAASLPKGYRIVDIGCGLQPYRQVFAHTDYIGLDVEDSGRKSNEKLADLYFDGTNVPMESESVDAILCTEVLEHAVDPVSLVREMYRILRKDGTVCITVPFMWGLHELPYDFRRYSPFGLAALFSEAGFFITHQENLTTGSAAIRMLIDSEINNFTVNILPKKLYTKNQIRKIRIMLWIHERLLRLVQRIWIKNFVFERLYVDNLLLCKKN